MFKNGIKYTTSGFNDFYQNNLESCKKQINIIINIIIIKITNSIINTNLSSKELQEIRTILNSSKMKKIKKKIFYLN